MTTPAPKQDPDWVPIDPEAYRKFAESLTALTPEAVEKIGQLLQNVRVPVRIPTDIRAVLTVVEDADILHATATVWHVEPTSVTVSVTGVEATSAVGNVSASSLTKPTPRGLDLSQVLAILGFLLQILQGTPWWDDYVKGQTPEAQAAERNLMAEDIAKRLASEFERSKKSDRWTRRISSDTYARASARANSSKVASLSQGLDVEVIGEEERATKIRWKADDGQNKVGWVFTRYLIKP